MENTNLFETPIRQGLVRKGIYFYQYKNGCINIQGKKYFGYSIKDAVKKWRETN